MKLNILGTEYEIIRNASVEEYPKLKNCDGYTDQSIKQIVIPEFVKDDMSEEDLEYYTKKVLRHEIVHAFMYESGLDSNSEYAKNEELIDWIAIQFEKMLAIFIDLDVIKIPDESVTMTMDLKVNLDEDKLKELLNRNIDDLVKIGGDG